jgi:tRNA A37 threonylcarbamoyladenosine modification protein TsaB
LQKVLPEHTLLIVSIASPLLLGIYQGNELIETVQSEEKTSDILLPLIREAMERYSLDHIIYTRGPGSYMAIKLTYLILKTMEIVKGITFEGCSAFELNGNRPIKAMGNLYFVKEKETIITKKFEQPVPQKFSLPASLSVVETDDEETPLYVLPAI